MSDIPSNSIAIVGVAGRFPGAANVGEFWNNLCSGTESIRRFKDSDLEDSFPPEVRDAPNFVRARPVLDDVELFDAGFFNMYAREAELTDPQHRLFLECCWEALEDAGYDPARYRGAVGVFAGSSMNTYFLNNVCAERRTIEEFTSNYQLGCYPALVGASQDFLATKVSYKLDLKGPAATVQTACSTSLYAVTQACQSLLLQQCDMALAGGVSITFPQKRGYLHVEGGMGSADGHCRAFDAEASGTVFGSGAGTVLLKRLEDAVADGDRIYAVIRGWGVNNDGAGKVGFTAPSVEGQAAAIGMALATAGVDARSIGYVECHGTATPLGDPIEIAGLTRAYREETADCGFCALGSVKTNIGHLDVAAGVAGLIKTALALRHGKLPASLHFRHPNPQIDFDATPFYVNARLADWPRAATPRRAGVSAFGVGGTNVHVVLEEAPAEAAEPAVAERPQLLVLSARSKPALDRACARLAQQLRQDSDTALADVAFTLQCGRRRFNHRRALVCRDREQAILQLADAHASDSRVGEADIDAPVAFMFPGQGAQYPGMGRALYQSDGQFRRDIDLCAGILQPLIGGDLRELLFADTEDETAARRLTSTLLAQPALFTVEFALARQWMRWGVRPTAMIGHSIGELVAATLAGVFSLEDALRFVAERGRLMQGLPGGAMLAVRLPESELRELLAPPLSIAAINGPSLCVVAGAYEAIEALEHVLQQRQAFSRRLHTSHAFHSPMVDPIVAPLRDYLADIELRPPQLRYVSCVTGDWIEARQATSPEYWAQHARQPVRFAESVARLAAAPAPLLLEVGPGSTLSTLARQTLRGQGPRSVSSLPDQGDETAADAFMLDALGRLWSAGVRPDWEALHGGRRRRVSLPGYPFERQRYWIDQPASGHGAAVQQPPADAPLQAKQDDSAMNDQQPIPPRAAPTADEALRRARDLIVALLEELSGERVEAPESSASFIERGFDSLFLSQVAQKLQARLKAKLTFRQLLGDYSTIPALAAFVADKLPPPAAAAPAPVSAAPALAAAAAAAGGEAVETLFREQMQAMSQLFSRQLEALHKLGPQQSAPAPAMAATPAAPAAVQAAPAAEREEPSRFRMYKPGQATSSAELSPAQHRHLQQLIARYTARTAGSKRSTQAHRAVLADPRAAAGFRAEWKEMVYPIVCARAAGSRLWDIDGNEYIDLVNGYGQTAFGHSPPFVVEAVKRQLDRGFAIGPQSDLAGEVAALFSELTGNERITFCNTGSEAVMAALRVARAVTGRDKVVVFNGDYHGQFDEVLVKALRQSGDTPHPAPVAIGIPGSAVQNMVVLEYAAPASLQWIEQHAEELAAVVVEPVQSRHPALQPFEFLRQLREITEKAGTALVMDEVVTGFRVHPAGVQGLTGIRADLATYGKVVGGGLPIGILAGKARFMDALDGGMWQYGDDSFPETGVTFFAGTFVRHPLALAACLAVLNHLKERGPLLQETLGERTAGLVDRLNGLFGEYRLKATVERFASFFYFSLHQDPPLAGLLFHHLRLRGIHIHDGFPCFLTTAHTDEDLQGIVEAFRSSLEELREAGIVGEAGPAATAPAAGPETVKPTESQMEIWLSAQLGDEASCAFNESVTLRLRGRLDTAALQRALQDLVDRHDALRSSFDLTGETLRIAGQLEFRCGLSDFSSRPPAQAEAALQALIDQDARTPFDLVAGPLARAHLVRLGTADHALVFSAHHIICDGWSINVLVEELAQLYSARCEGRRAQLPAPLPFALYARRLAEDASRARNESYWTGRFAEPVAPLNLWTDRPRAAVKSFSGATCCHRIGADLYRAIKQAGAAQGCTLFVELLAAFMALMGRLASQEEVVVGVPTAGQSLLEDETLVGHCVNFLPIRGRWTARTSVAEHLAEVRKTVLDAYEHQNYTLGTLVRQLSLPRDTNRLPLTEIQFNLERLSDRINLAGLETEVTPNAKAFVNFDLFFNVIESDRGLRIDCDYNTNLFDQATIECWLACYQALLESFAADHAQALVRAPLLPFPALQDFAKGAACAEAPPASAGLLTALKTWRREKPAAIAARFNDRTLTYEELDRRSSRLAGYLSARLAHGAPGVPSRVGILAHRSLDLLVSLLAVLKAGCAYVPLDPTHPAARLRHILGDAGVAALITDLDEPVAALADGAFTLHLRRDAAAIDAAQEVDPPGPPADHGLAYLIYTSGSTGVPKGVEISHGSLNNFLNAMALRPGLSGRDTMLAVTTVSFDIAALELYLPLLTGATVVIAGEDDVNDGFALASLAGRFGATAMQATPATWRLLLEAGFRPPAGFKMLCGGEALPRDLASRLLRDDGELWNMYGPTETTVWSSCARITRDAPITVGRPILNTRFYVLDHHDQPVPAGIPGQLHIAGDGVAIGYHDRPDLTADKFVAAIFGGGRMYRTGDLARQLPCGDFEILGRRDHQVKLRGFRIELGEIEAVLARTSADLKAVTVQLREDIPGQAQLVAYLVAKDGAALSPAAMRAALAHCLPEYMIPAAWVELAAMPRTPNGKLDRAALPPPAPAAAASEQYEAPRTATESALAEIWAEVLKRQRVGIHDDIFDLAADSIQLFQITARANRRGLQLTAKQLIRCRTIAELAPQLENSTAPAAEMPPWRNARNDAETALP